MTDAFEDRERAFENHDALKRDVALVALAAKFGEDKAGKDAYLEEHGGLSGAIQATLVELEADPARMQRAYDAVSRARTGESGSFADRARESREGGAGMSRGGEKSGPVYRQKHGEAIKDTDANGNLTYTNYGGGHIISN